jgi:nucleoside-diphosphate-sugar epimerase
MILLIGQTGYLGSLLLSSGFKDKIVSPTSSRLSRLINDIPKNKLSEVGIEQEQIEDVIIVASKPKLEKWTLNDFHSNTGIVNGVVKHFAKSRITFFSTVDVYGNSPDLPLTESSSLAGNSLYAKSKILSEKILRDSYSSDQILIFRLPGVYGGSQKAHGLMDLFVRNIRCRQPIILDSKDVLEVRRDWVYGPDIARLMDLIVSDNQFTGGVFNLVSGNAPLISQWIEYAERIANSKAKVAIRDPMIHHEIFDLVFNRSKLSEFFPKFTFTSVENSLIL